MRSVIVPVFSQSDLEALPNCLRYLAQQNVEQLLVLHGPNVGIVNADATKEHDQRIANLDTRKKELVLVDDFEGAKKAKEEIETLKVERDMAVREGWKKVPEDQRAAAYKKAFANLGTEAICLREAYQHDQIFTMLQAFLPQWPSDVPHGEYSIVWPRSIGKFVTPQRLDMTGDVSGRDVRPMMPPLTARDRRAAELKSMHHIKAISVARDAGIEVKGRKVKDVIDDLLAKEFPEPAVAA